MAGVPRPPADRTTRSAGKKTVRAPTRARTPTARPPRITTSRTLQPVTSRAPFGPRVVQEAAAVPLGAVGAAQDAAAAAAAAVEVDHLGGGARVEAGLLAELEQPAGRLGPAPPVGGAHRHLPRQLLELPVQVDAQLPQRPVHAQGVARAQGGRAAGARAVDVHQPLGASPHAHGREHQADHPLVEQQPPVPQPLHPAQGQAEGAELPAGLQDGHLVGPLQLPRGGGPAGPAAHHDRPRGTELASRIPTFPPGRPGSSPPLR